MLRPRSRRSTVRPRSVSSLAAHPPEIPEPTTIASYVGWVMTRSSDGADGDRLLERAKRVPGRLELVGDESRETPIGEGPGDRPVVELLALVDLVAAGDAAGVEVPDVRQVTADRSDPVAFHD